jgi:anti-sigma28 factor (negative regulator of flagellin synthesis)
MHPPTGPGGIESAGRPRDEELLKPASGVADTVEISMAAKLAAKIEDGRAIRTDLVEKVRNEIAAGAYETNQRIEATVERILSELLSEW